MLGGCAANSASLASKSNRCVGLFAHGVLKNTSKCSVWRDEGPGKKPATGGFEHIVDGSQVAKSEEYLLS